MGMIFGRVVGLGLLFKVYYEMLKICVLVDGIIRGGVGWRFFEYWYCTLFAIVIRVIL